jgi:hypothetical protein
MTTKSDAAIAAVRQVRQDISREFGNDPRRLVEHYMDLQKAFDGPLVTGHEEAAAQPCAPPDGHAAALPGRP